MSPIKLLLCNKHIFLRTLLFIYIVSFSITSCISKRYDVFLPPPSESCPIKMNWNSIIPGVSTRQDVVNQLGNPNKKGKIKFPDGNIISFYTYEVEGGAISKFVQNRIFFRSSNIVDWIEVVIADQDGQFHTVKEIVDQLGNLLDIIYTNDDYNPYNKFQYDVIAGPDQVYVWSECGLALLVLKDYKKSDSHKLEFSPVGHNDPQIFKMRYPRLDTIGRPVKDLDRVIMMEFLFEPTNFDSFENKYHFKIPYGLWDDFLDCFQNEKYQCPGS